jgi:hypothetical protein
LRASAASIMCGVEALVTSSQTSIAQP